MSHAIVNITSAIAVLALLAVLLRARPGQEPPKSIKWHYAAIVAAVFAAFAPGFNVPLLHDSYGLVYLPSTQAAADLARLFYAHPLSGDFFFRPLSYTLFWMYGKFAGLAPLPWHLLCVSLHAINACLVFLLGRRLKLPGYGALVAALLFALSGTRPEAVTWVAARVDLFATLFVLLSLLVIQALSATERHLVRHFSMLILLATAALLSKESAYCLPVLASAMLAASQWTRRCTTVVLLLALVTGVAFLYRHWVLGSIGGYGAAGGDPAILHFSLLRSFEALAFRMWGSLTVPLNWSISPGPLFWISAVLAIPLLALRTRVDRRLLLACIAMTIAAALPAQHLLLLGSDLNGARVLYLPSVGFALFWGAFAGGIRMRYAAVALLLFQLVTLEHNLVIWRSVAERGEQACRSFAEMIGTAQEPVSVEGLPIKEEGVYFLSNSFPLCVMMNSDRTQPPAVTDNAKRVYRWNDAQSHFEKVR